MPLTFAISLFIVACVGEVVRQSGMNLHPLAALSAVAAVMAVAGLVLVGRDCGGLIRPRSAWQYGFRAVGWTWQRTGVLMLATPFLFLIPAAFAATFTSFLFVPPNMNSLAAALVVQIAVVSLAQELFFREAVLKVFGASFPVAFAVTAVAVLLFYLPHGLPAATIAASASLAYMALRIAGMNLFVVAIVHGAMTVLFGRVVVAQIAVDAVWPYAVAIAGGYCVFAVGLIALTRIAPQQAIRRVS